MAGKRVDGPTLERFSDATRLVEGNRNSLVSRPVNPRHPRRGGGGGGGTVNIKYGRALHSYFGMRKAPEEPDDITDTDGALTTRTNDAEGVLTLASGHGIEEDDFIDIFWEGGARYRNLVTADTSTTVTFESSDNSPAFGDVLPADETEVLARPRPQQADFAEIEAEIVLARGEFAVYEEVAPVFPDPAEDWGTPDLPTRLEPAYNVSATVGALTTRTDDDTGVLTMDDDEHGAETGDIVDVIWADGVRYRMDVTDVVDEVVDVDGGEGDVLPADETPVTIRVRKESNLKTEIWELPFSGDINKNGWAVAINGKAFPADFVTLRDPDDYPPPPLPPP